MKADGHHIILRYAFITVCILLLSTTIVYSLFKTTVTYREEWKAKGDSALSIKKIIHPKRGDILACDGSILATNVNRYTARIDFRCKSFMEERYKIAIDSLADSLATHFGIRTKDKWVEYLNAPLKKDKSKRSRCYTILKNISYSDYLKLKSFPFLCIKSSNKNGLTRDVQTRRSNPYGRMALRSIGVVGETPKSKERHGVWGLEKDLDSFLYGKPGISQVVPVNLNTVNWVEKPATDGYSVKTTIDVNMQDIVENELEKVLSNTKADWGVAILMNVESGDIKAIANLEMDTADHNRYIEGMNRAVLGFEPGSVMKPISMLVALEKGWVKNPNDVIATGNRYKYANGPAICDCSPVASMPICEIIERSSNVGMTKLIMPHITHAPQFKQHLREIGFLEPLNLHIAGERVPRIRDVGNSNWDYIDVSRMTYGYATEIPPVYTLAIYNAIANNGQFVRPRLVTSLIGNEKIIEYPVSYIRERICTENNAKILQDMLARVVWGEHGTARRLLKNDLVKIAGKTGTCYAIHERIKINKKTGMPITKDMYGRDIANGQPGTYDKSRKRLSFCGFFPADNPKYSCFVMVFHPKNGMGAAATSGVVLKEIALKMYSRGMLDNESDYKKEQTPGTRPTLYASNNPTKHESIKSGLNINNIARFPDNDTISGIPSVKGLGVREALTKLEQSGYNVDIEGVGYVIAQAPVAGTNLPKGSRVKLKLTEF